MFASSSLGAPLICIAALYCGQQFWFFGGYTLPTKSLLCLAQIVVLVVAVAVVAMKVVDEVVATRAVDEVVATRAVDEVEVEVEAEATAQAFEAGEAEDEVEGLQWRTPNQSIPAPNPEVTKVEDSFQSSLSAGGGLGGLSINAKFPHRPGYGTKGKKVILWANYFEMIPSPDLLLYRYNVRVQPDAIGKKLSQIVKLLLQLPAYSDFQDDIVTDFKSTLVSRRRLGPGTADWTIPYRAEGEDEPLARAQTYRIRVEETGTLTVSALMDYLTSTNVNAAYADKEPVLQALNIFLGHYAKSSPGIATVGSSKSFSLAQATPKLNLGAGLTALRGFFSSVRVATCRILVNVNVSHAAFYDAIRLDQLIQSYGQATQRNRVKLESFLKRVRVKVTHLAEKKNKSGQSVPRVKTIFGLAHKDDGYGLDHPPRVQIFGAGSKAVEFYRGDSPGAPSSSSAGQAAGTPGGKGKGKGKKGGAAGHGPDPTAPQSGKYISVWDFFERVHKRSIASSDLPVVNVGNRENPSYLPAEVCVVMPGQNSQAKLDPAQTQQMIRFAVRKPWENANSIVQEGLPTVGLLPQTNVKLGRFGVSVTARLITVPGRVLNEPKVKYKQDNFAQVRGGSWNMQGIKFNTGGTLHSWTYLMISMGNMPDAFSKDSLSSTVAQFHQALLNMGIHASPPRPGMRLMVSGPDDTSIETTLKNVPGDPKYARLVLVILPIAHTLLYNRIKHAGDVKVGVHTVCVVGSKFAKAQPQYFANVALKFNLKVGGINQLVDNTRLGIINEDKTMVVGVDVTHPSPGSASNAPSVAGMVASVDRWLGQWPADLRIQRSRKEMVSELDSMLKSRLHLWKTQGKHKTFPDNLLVYRDGVSEGQYSSVLDEELPLLRKACAELYPPPDTKKGLPRITIIIVGKRHHTRFYPTSASDADRSSNPQNGTVVDRGVTEARNWDFFLQSHTALQGTARPAHYYIVLDEIFTKQKIIPPFQNVADVLEDLTHSMCYLFGRATKAVSICPPAYYADIVCERARCYLSGLFDMSTPSATPAQSVAGGGGSTEAKTEDVLIHPDLRNTMFYI
ncbi:MAG: hypothetical protein Q9173_004437 [Seirophora scorigena]